MSKLLSYLRALFKMSGSQALPSNSKTDYQFSDFSDWIRIQMPFNGYFVAGCDYSGNVALRNDTSRIYSSSSYSGGGYAACFVLAKKGDTIAIKVNGSDTTNTVFWAVPTVGSS